MFKLGIKTFYGQAFLPDICELGEDMLPYSKQYFLELLNTGFIKEIKPSTVWYKERLDFSVSSLNVNMQTFPNYGFELLQGLEEFSGEILGGCLETIYSLLDKNQKDSYLMNKYFKIFPSLEDWKGKILLLETSEDKSSPELFSKMIILLKKYGIFEVISGLLVGKPANNQYYEEYKRILKKEVNNANLPIVFNINVGHSNPRCIIPFGISCTVNVKQQIIKFLYK